MAKVDFTVLPFPDDTNRDEFGSWLSGFVDGEGTFDLYMLQSAAHPTLSCHSRLQITVRDDDTEALRLILSFWGCGRINFHDNVRCRVPNANPIARLTFSKIADHMNIIIPHFERYPLRAKKRNDYLIWKRGVELRWSIGQRETHRRIGGDFPAKWTTKDRNDFIDLSKALRGQRRYVRDSEQVALPDYPEIVPAVSRQRDLFPD